MSKTGLKYLLSLFFLGLAGCVQKETNAPAELVWQENKAVEVILSNTSIVDLPEEQLPGTLRVELGDTGEPILGQFFKRHGNVVFRPLVPFTRGLHYHVLVNEIILTELNIPLDEKANIPELTIFPSMDTVPENILKIYLRFSEPMVEGRSLNYVHLVNDKGDTLQGTFLDLQPELWNVDGTMLTLWFDPGRVKRDLIPNRELGNPILNHQQYKLTVNGTWKSKSGKQIGKTTTKNFWVKARDEKIPTIESWTFNLPKSDTDGDLVIHFKEPLDYSLIQSCIQIRNRQNDLVGGNFSVIENEQGIQFHPERTWKKDIYILEVETKLEDLAGNNLLRPFDRDITKVGAPAETPFVFKKFEIQ